MRWNYRKKLELSIVLILFLLNLLFFFLPRLSPLPARLPTIHFQQIKMIQIPRTIQKTRQNSPPPVRPSIPVPSDDIEMLEEMPLKASSEVTSHGKFSTNTPLADDDLPYAPRQLVEVLPRVDDLKVKGEIVVRLLIDTQGKIKDYTVLSNTTGSKECLRRVLRAAKKSRWEVVHLNNNKVEYWITKRYQFK